MRNSGVSLLRLRGGRGQKGTGEDREGREGTGRAGRGWEGTGGDGRGRAGSVSREEVKRMPSGLCPLFNDVMKCIK